MPDRDAGCEVPAAPRGCEPAGAAAAQKPAADGTGEEEQEQSGKGTEKKEGEGKRERQDGKGSEGKTVPMEVSSKAKVRDVARRVLRTGSECDQDVCSKEVKSWEAAESEIRAQCRLSGGLRGGG